MMKKYSKIKICITVILCILFVGIVSMIIKNQFNAYYEQLNETDQHILNEFNEYCKYTGEKDIWDDFCLGEKTILVMDGSFGKGYLINPAKEINSVFAKKIQMPSDYEITVYRIAPLAPQLLQFIFEGNFNSIDKEYSVYDNQVYFTKYNDTASISTPFTSEHFMTFLSHEAFHYYMQNDWADGSTYLMDEVSDEDLDLLYQEYEVLDKIQKALMENVSEQKLYFQYAEEYVNIVEKRLKKNFRYVKQELERETIEGTATYAGIKASEIVGYDYGVMYFDNVKNVPFSEIAPNVKADNYKKAKLADRIPYESGSLLCLFMDELKVPNWQKRLNEQTRNSQMTIYSLIKEYMQERQ